jgi:CBS domain-containing protein
MTAKPICVPPETSVSDALVIMIERGFRHLPIVQGPRILGVFSLRDALPRELGAALAVSEFNEQINDALG